MKISPSAQICSLIDDSNLNQDLPFSARTKDLETIITQTPLNFSLANLSHYIDASNEDK
jgi:hypothetical protein